MFQIHNLTFHLKELENGAANKAQIQQNMGEIKIRAEISNIETNKQTNKNGRTDQ